MTLVRLVFANAVLLAARRARGAGARAAERVGDARLVAGADLRRARGHVRRRLVADADARAAARRRGSPPRWLGRGAPRPERIPGRQLGLRRRRVLGLLLWHVAGEIGGDGLFHLARVRKLDAFDSLSLDAVNEFADGGLHPGYAFPLWHGFLALVARVGFLDPADVVLHEATVLAPVALLVAYEAGWALFRRVGPAVAVVCGAVAVTRARTRARRRVHRARAAGDRVAPDPAPGRARARARLRRAARPRRCSRRSPPPGSCSPSSTRPTRSSSGCRSAGFLVVRSLVERREAKRIGARARRARRPGGGVPRRGCCRSCATPRSHAPGGDELRARVPAVRRPARRLLGHELPPRARGLRPGRRGRGGGAPLRPARRARAPAPLGGVRARRLPRGRGGDARAAALRALLRPRLDLAVAPRGRLLAARVRVRGRLRRARGAAARRSSCRSRSPAGSCCSSSTRASSPTGSRTAARRSSPGSPSSAGSLRSW